MSFMLKALLGSVLLAVAEVKLTRKVCSRARLTWLEPLLEELRRT